MLAKFAYNFKSFGVKNIRSSKIRKNIFFSLLLKGISILISFILVPLTLNYLNTTEYGVWLTLSSILTWINLFDIGLGNGLRNKLTEALTNEDMSKAKSLVSTTFILLAIIIMSLFACFALANPFLNWGSILNTTVLESEKLSEIVLMVFGFFSLQFVFKTVGTIFVSMQKPSLNDLMITIGSLFSLIIIYILTKTTKGSLTFVALTFSASPAVIFIVSYFVVFYGKLRNIRPSLSSFKLSYGKELMGLGAQFFILQISGIIVYFTSNIIIAQLFSPYEVTIYNIAYKYANIISIASLIIITPLWSSSTEAYHLRDFIWFKKIEKKMLYIFSLLVLTSIVICACAPLVYKLWIGKELQIPISLNCVVILFNILFSFSSIYIYMLNGIGKIRLQLYSSIIEIIFTIPVCIILGKLLNIQGIVLGMTFMVFLRCIWAPIQFRKIITETASGIWNK
ncbi:MAG: oligosaccharide flippase family protein [Paludibacteraceae bacterium]